MLQVWVPDSVSAISRALSPVIETSPVRKQHALANSGLQSRIRTVLWSAAQRVRGYLVEMILHLEVTYSL